ncbi:MAG: DUF2812 domain-containing protein [Pseudoflavonifractor sp.]
MSNSVYRLLLGDISQFGRNESWFSAMAARGLFLEKIGGTAARFRRGTPEKRKYRMEVSNSLSPERLALYEECGWEYVCNSGLFFIFCAPDDPAIPELHTDPTVQADTLVALDRMLRTPTLVVLITTPLIFLLLCSTYLFSPEPFLTMVGGSAVSQFILMLMEGYTLFTTLRTCGAVRKLRRSLQAGVPMDHNRPYRGSRFVGGLVLVMVCLFTAVVLGSVVGEWSSRREASLLPAEVELPILQLSDVEENCSAFGTDPGQIQIRFRWTALAPVCLETDQRLPGEKGDYRPNIEAQYYRLALTPLAKGLLTDLIHRYAERYEGQRPECIDLPPFDDCYLLEREGNSQAFLRMGKQVLYLNYDGSSTENFAAALPLQAERMATLYDGRMPDGPTNIPID